MVQRVDEMGQCAGDGCRRKTDPWCQNVLSNNNPDIGGIFRARNVGRFPGPSVHVTGDVIDRFELLHYLIRQLDSERFFKVERKLQPAEPADMKIFGNSCRRRQVQPFEINRVSEGSGYFFEDSFMTGGLHGTSLDHCLFARGASMIVRMKARRQLR